MLGFHRSPPARDDPLPLCPLDRHLRPDRAAAGRLRHDLRSAAQRLGRDGGRRDDREPAPPLRPRPAHLCPVLALDLRRHARRLRLFLPVAGAGEPAHLGQYGPHGAGHALDPHVHLGHRLSDRRLLGRAKILGRRHGRDLPRLSRPRHAELPDGADPHVCGRRLFRPGCGRALLPAISGRSLELGQVPRPPGPSLDARGRARHLRHRQPDPHHAREPAGRAATSPMSPPPAPRA